MDKRSCTTHLVIHHTEGDRFKQTVAQITEFHMAPPPDGRGWLACAYQRVIRGNGDVKSTNRPDWAKGAHDPAFNDCSMGIACTGNFSKKGSDRMVADRQKDPQYAALLQTCAILCKRYGIEAKNIIGHCDGYATECPGQIHDILPQLRKDVAAYL